MAGYWIKNSSQPPPKNAPHLRNLQHACGITTLNWLKHRGSIR